MKKKHPRGCGKLTYIDCANTHPYPQVVHEEDHKVQQYQ